MKNILYVLMFSALIIACAKGKPMNSETIEIVTFRLKAGVTEKQFLAENSNVEKDHVAKQPGFISRETARGEDGEWLVVVHWRSVADADASMNSFSSAPGAGAFMSLMDDSTLKMKRYNKIKEK